MTAPTTDEAFARHVLEAGVVTEEQFRTALQAQAQTALAGRPTPLPEILVERGMMTPVQKDLILKKIKIQEDQRVKTLGPYKLKRKLGGGGMGVVYLARDTRTRQLLALKILPKRLGADQAFVARFLREVDAATRLNHPNILQAYSYGEDHGYHYYVMEYCEGLSLADRLKRDPFLPPEEATWIVMQVARGLKYAHDMRIVHRDIKPSNVMVTPQGDAKLLDLGLSKNLSETEQALLTMTGVAIGTPHYIAPEQTGSDKAVDGRADIYSLGATYYHLLTGRPPFEGTTAYEIITKHLSQQVPDPRDLREDIPDGVVHVIRRMMAKRPEDRYQDCAELVDDLEKVAAGGDPASQPLAPEKSSVAIPVRFQAGRKAPAKLRPRTSRSPRAPQPPVRNSVLLIGGVVVCAGLMIALLVSALNRPGGRGPASPAMQKPASQAPSPAKERDRQALSRWNELLEQGKSGQVPADEMMKRYREFASTYADTPTGEAVIQWLNQQK
jgi:serine/threonine protein kinase